MSQSANTVDRGPRARCSRAEQVALIGLAILEALVIFGAVVPALLKQSPAAQRVVSQEVSDD